MWSLRSHVPGKPGFVQLMSFLVTIFLFPQQPLAYNGGHHTMEEEHETAAEIAEAAELSAQEDEGSFPLTGGSAHETLWCHASQGIPNERRYSIIGESFGSSVSWGIFQQPCFGWPECQGGVHLCLFFMFFSLYVCNGYLYICISIYII